MLLNFKETTPKQTLVFRIQSKFLTSLRPPNKYSPNEPLGASVQYINGKLHNFVENMQNKLKTKNLYDIIYYRAPVHVDLTQKF